MARTADPGLAERRRSQILEAALRCFRRRGFHQSTMQEICAEAGISPGALYRYFDSKNAIIVAIAEEEHKAQAPDACAMAEDGDVVEAIARLADAAFAHFSVEEDRSIIADVMAEAVRDADLRNRFMEQARMMRAGVAALIAKAQAEGRVAAGLDPEQAARTMMATIDGLGLQVSVLRDGDMTRASGDFRAFLAVYLAPHSHPQNDNQRKETSARVRARAKESVS